MRLVTFAGSDRNPRPGLLHQEVDRRDGRVGLSFAQKITTEPWDGISSKISSPVGHAVLDECFEHNDHLRANGH
jgi:hypothetical protein